MEYKMDVDFGSVEYEGKTLKLHQPYIDGPYEYATYRACADDEEGNQYEIIWDIINTDCENESEACDWEVFRVNAL